MEAKVRFCIIRRKPSVKFHPRLIWGPETQVDGLDQKQGADPHPAQRGRWLGWPVRISAGDQHRCLQLVLREPFTVGAKV